MRVQHTLILTALAFALSCGALAQNTAMPWQMLSGGFGSSGVSNSELITGVGQSFVGRTAGTGSVIESGFLSHPLFRGPILGLDENQAIPAEFSLSQNYPNPFNPTTTIHFDLPRKGQVVLEVYNILGQKVTTLVNDEREAARYDIVWNGTTDFGVRVASGVYFYRVVARPSDGSSPFVSLKKMVLLK